MIALRLNKRRDGSYVVLDVNGSATGPDRAFPDVHAFTYDRLLDFGPAAKIDGDQLTLELANATAVYRITERRAATLDVELVDESFTEPTPIDEARAEEIAAAREAASTDPTELTQAHAGRAVVDEDA